MTKDTKHNNTIYSNNKFIILMLIFLPPIGLFLMFKFTKWNKILKIALIPIILFYTLIYVGIIGNSLENNNKSIQVDKTQTDYSTTQKDKSTGKGTEETAERLYLSNVNDDVTNNWRLYITSDNDLIDIENHAIDYYNKAFKNDSEVHAIVNFSNRTTTRINSNGSNLYVTIYDYVENEEHSAKTLFSGTQLADYIIYLNTGDIEKVE